MVEDPHGIENEPHLKSNRFELDTSEAEVAARLNFEQSQSTEADAVEHTVWSEPTVSTALAGEPDETQLTYRKWLTSNIQRTTWFTSIWVMILVALAGGPWSVMSAMYVGSTGASIFSILMFTVFGPVSEEVAKVAAALWVIEKRPFYFKSIWQIFVCAGCAGLAFAAIENLIYMYVYVPDHTPEFVQFRWTVCVFLHVSCSLVAAVGLARIWDNAIRNLHPPRLAMGVPWFSIAMGGHGLYNLSVIIAGAAGWLDFGMPGPPGE